MVSFTNSFSFDDYLHTAIVLAHNGGMSYDDISAVLYKKSVVCRCMSEGEKSGLNKQLLEVVKSVMEVKQ